MSEKGSKEPQQTYGWSQYEKLRKMEEVVPKTMPEPFTVPKGYKPESLKELWQYAQRRHPYARYGYGLVFIFGLAAYAGVTMSKVDQAHQESKEARAKKEASKS